MTELRRVILDYAVFLVLFAGSILGHYWFVFVYKPKLVIRVPVTDREAGRTQVAIQIVAARPKPKLELEEIVKEVTPQELPKPPELVVAKVDLPPEPIITAEIPSPKAPPAPPPPPPMEKIEDEKPPEEKPPEPRKRKQETAKPPEPTPIESENTATIVQEEMRGVDRPPRALFNPVPVYPAALLLQGVQSTLDLSVTIDETGKATSVTVLRSSGYPEMDQSAVTAVLKWKFAPAERGGKAVAHAVTQLIRFTIGPRR